MTKTPTQSIESYFKPYAIPHYVTHAENIVKWLEDEGWDIVRREATEIAGKPLSELEGEAWDRGFQHGLEAALSPSPAVTAEPVAWRWKPRGSVNWIYDPRPEWFVEHKDEIDHEPLYATPPIRGDQQTFYTILSKYFPKDATFDNLWQELKEEGLVR